MILKKFFPKSNYQKSNSILNIAFQPSPEAKKAVRRFQNITNTNLRQSLGTKLVAYLSFDAKIPPAKLKISATRQWHTRKNGKMISKLYGYYRPKSKYIYIQNLTSVQGKPVAAKTFLSTLLHEWLHHYETEKFKLYSIHTKGFYLRLSCLKNALDF